MYAGVEPSPVEGLGRFQAVVHDLALASGTRDAELAFDLRERLALSNRCLELKAQIVGEVFVFFFSCIQAAIRINPCIMLSCLLRLTYFGPVFHLFLPEFKTSDLDFYV